MTETKPVHFILSAPEIDGRRVITNVWSSAAILEQETPDGWQRVSLPHPMTDVRYRMSVSPIPVTGDTAALEDKQHIVDRCQWISEAIVGCDIPQSIYNEIQHTLLVEIPDDLSRLTQQSNV